MQAKLKMIAVVPNTEQVVDTEDIEELFVDNQKQPKVEEEKKVDYFVRPKQISAVGGA